MKKALAVCGEIGSGKSSIIRELRRQHGGDIVSFGSYVKSLVTEKNPSRETYQSLGQKLFASRGPGGLLEDTIRFNRPLSNTHLIDGVRHVSILSELRRDYGDCLVVFLRVGDQQRFERFSSRNKSGSLISYEEFLLMCRHPIEQGISEIEPIADAVIDASRDFERVIEEVASHLSRREFY